MSSPSEDTPAAHSAATVLTAEAAERGETAQTLQDDARADVQTDALCAEASDALESGKLEVAVEKLTEAIQLGCTDSILYNRRGKLLLDLGRPSPAVDDCTAAIALNPNSGTAYKIRGKAYVELLKWEEAYSDLSTCLKLDYDEDTAELASSVSAKLTSNSEAEFPAMSPPVAGEISEEVQAAQAALKTEAAESLDEGKPEVALEKLTEAIKLGCTSALLYCRRARLLLDLGRPRAAANDCTAALALNPDSGAAYKIRAKSRMKIAAWDDARSDFSSALRLDYDEDTEEAAKFVKEKIKELKRKVQEEAQQEQKRRKEADFSQATDIKGHDQDVKQPRQPNPALCEEPPFPAMSPAVPDAGLSEVVQATQNDHKTAALEALEEGKLELALEKYTAAIRLGCTSALLYCRRAKLLLDLERPRAAANDCTAALTLNPDSGAAYKIRGKAHMRLEAWDSAKADFTAGVKIDYDEDTEDLVKVVDEKVREKKRKTQEESEERKRKAQEELEEQERKRQKASRTAAATEEELDREWRRQMEAELAEDSAEEDGEQEEEEEELEDVVPDEWDFPAMSPPIPEEGLPEEVQSAQNELKTEAAEALECGYLELALEKLTDAIQLGCTSSLLYSRRAKLLLDLGRPLAAESDCTAALDLNADSGTAYKIRGKAYVKLARWEEACADISCGLKLDYDEETHELSKLAHDKMKASAARRRREEWDFCKWLKRREAEQKQEEQRRKLETESRERQEAEKKQAQAAARREAFEALRRQAPDVSKLSLAASLDSSKLAMNWATPYFIDSASEGCVQDSDVKVLDHGGKVVETMERYATFEETPFPESLKSDLAAAGFPAPSQIQQYTWPLAVRDIDVVGVAATGSGKTLAFLLPAFSHILQKSVWPGKPTFLVIAPTRELAIQIEEEAIKFGHRSGIRTVCCYGGSPRYEQAAAIRAGVHGVIGTPGRINDFLESWQLQLHKVKKLVLDEADRMLDMGFEPQIRSIISQVPSQRHTLFFTATWPAAIRRLASDFLQDAYQVQIGNRDELKGNQDITQVVKLSGPSNQGKTEHLVNILRQGAICGMARNAAAKALVFCNTKKGCELLSQILPRSSITCSSIHGDKDQQMREFALANLREGRIQVMIATDVAARGLDIKGVTLVVNYDVPKNTEDYVHRIGRTGRAGQKGFAVTLIADHEASALRRILKVMARTNQEVPEDVEHMAKFGVRPN